LTALNLKCSRCYGEGSRRSLDPEEEDRGIEDLCYHCGGSGRVDEETARHDAKAALIASLAAEMVRAEKKARDEDPEGENWAFCAAEDMLSEYEYTQARVWDREANIWSRVEGREFSTREELLALLADAP
jgi:hypothetical protein